MVDFIAELAMKSNGLSGPFRTAFVYILKLSVQYRILSDEEHFQLWCDAYSKGDLVPSPKSIAKD